MRARAAARAPEARARIRQILARHRISLTLERLVEHVCEHARITLNFHPDRLRRADGLSAVEGLLLDGRYRSQFETGVTNGSPTAFPGGERDQWEKILFGSAYHAAEELLAERPKYGGLNLMHHADGASPRFGSCHLVLHRAVLARSTLTWGDSHQGPEHAGTVDVLEPVLGALLDAVDRAHEALGVSEIDVPDLLRRLASPPVPAIGRALDAYIEAQVHGSIDLATDVQAIVIDPSFAGTEVGDRLHALAQRFGVALRTHPGFVLAPTEVPADFRGPRMIPIAARIDARFGGRGRIAAATLGRAAASLRREPDTWSDFGTPAETWQLIKQLWHVLVRFGRPFA